MANPIKQSPKREIDQVKNYGFCRALLVNACYKTDEFRHPNFGGRISGELLHDSIRYTYKSSDISNVVELRVMAEECPIDVVMLLRGAVGALASSY
ncbi:hypothetical protein THAOC_14092 [Thalassiosira oceanica]|uniref:Uncharacterized protein n=1 Tax=Thalassiosira oceanica TaxID=159749 RepID=K0SIA5_THAOC|nr:hypothetical protein THAOC_14092 [Thalassiosira oceanica]|eukprot:EJK65100.1 hypothetical protein THAOC_14092 [Thalassiosira oceanica]